MSWAVWRTWDDSGETTGLHVLPMEVRAGEEFVVGGHTADPECFCEPKRDDEREDGIPVYQHHAPEHPGSLERVQ